jgi:hypothetical protein
MHNVEFAESATIDDVHVARTAPDPTAWSDFHNSSVRPLEGRVERLVEDYWRVAKEVVDIDGNGISIRVLSTLDLESQIRGEAVTWLDRELIAEIPTGLAQKG